MSTLTQFLPQGDSFLGEFVNGSSVVWGSNPIFAGKEFLQTGFTKTYSNDYAVLASNFPQAVINSQIGVANSGWNIGQLASAAIGGASFGGGILCLFYLDGNYHQILLGGGSVIQTTQAFSRYGTSMSSAPTNGIVIDNGTSLGADTAEIFNNAILYIICNSTAAENRVWRSTGTTYSNAYTLPNGGVWTLTSSPSLVIGFSTANANTTTLGTVVTSTNGTSWTSTNTTANVTPTANERCARLIYSTVGGNFILVTTLGNIFTSTNGTAWTSRTKPTGMPSALSITRGNNKFLAANSATATLISVGQGKFIRTTDGTTFTLIDLSIDAAINAWFPNTSVPEITYDGTYFTIMNPALTTFAYSSDDGLTFIIDYQKLVKTTSTINFYSNSLNFVNNEYWYYMISGIGSGLTGASGYNLGTRVFRSTPQFVGSTIAVTFASGSTYSSYLRIK